MSHRARVCDYAAAAAKGRRNGIHVAQLALTILATLFTVVSGVGLAAAIMDGTLWTMTPSVVSNSWLVRVAWLIRESTWSTGLLMAGYVAAAVAAWLGLVQTQRSPASWVALWCIGSVPAILGVTSHAVLAAASPINVGYGVMQPFAWDGAAMLQFVPSVLPIAMIGLAGILRRMRCT